MITRFGFFLFVIFTYFLVLFFYCEINNTLDVFNYVTFLFITVWSTFKISINKYAYSFNVFYWLFVLLFFAIFPTLQYSTKAFPWGDNPTEATVLKANCIIIFSCMVYETFYFWGTRNREGSNGSLSKLWTVKFSPLNYKIGFIIFLFCSALIVNTLGFSSLFSRANVNEVSSESGASTIQMLLFDKLTRSPILFFTLITINFYFIEKKISWLTLLIVLTISIITNFPLALPRYFLGAFYLGVILNCKRVLKSPLLIPSVLICSLIIVFPLLTLSRYSFATWSYIVDNFSSIISLFWSSGDFDAYSMLCRSISYVDSHSMSYGGQLAGAMFFFVPRAIWPNKPVGTGFMIAESLGWDFKNVSCPFVAECFVNFGYLGILVLIGIVAYVIARYDKFYWQYLNSAKSNNFWIVLYPSLMGLFFFMLRGDLMSSYAYIFGLLTVALMFQFILRLRWVEIVRTKTS
ncbi:oligosaccharide repeat unit polymerase [Solitalea sp. MAHUQ-68]|uniref:Oligosaccharide repeat unit polymerase n=1 Tax=Solitalea agri TaxID=2953739 RepID=A0A9X2F2V0_9SPHI|nr:O-antigen polymerase [Solitalea agri]MCO4293120.1 oligosaccharide repeat unit polymerase [Solitalea agri]